MTEYVKIYSCGDCIQYHWKRHCCLLGAKDEGKPTDRFYRDCPLGICREEQDPFITTYDSLDYRKKDETL